MLYLRLLTIVYNAGPYEMVSDGVFAMPTTPDFYLDLFTNATRSSNRDGGLGVSRMVLFEQDFLSYWMNGAGAGPWHYTLASATAGADFLLQQNNAALEVGAKIQCDCRQIDSFVARCSSRSRDN
jgi:hypothetical protein